jgi:hypothetical protein
VESTQCDYFLDLAGLCTNKDTLNKYAQIVNDHLTHRTVLVGESGITIADLYVWEQLAGECLQSGRCPPLPHTVFKDRSTAGVMLAIVE